MRWNRQGVTREVILTKRWAIKLPKLTYGWLFFLHGLLANMQERGVWSMRLPECCPVLFALPGGFLLVMRYARPLTDEEWFAMDIEQFREQNIPVEYKRDSFGMLDGRVVAVDYGS